MKLQEDEGISKMGSTFVSNPALATELVKNPVIREVEGIEIPEEEKYEQVDRRIIQDLDMLIVGAGISGVNMSYRLQEAFPKKTYVVLEQRAAMGGTWDLMKYPGIRSDSDLHSFGFAWRPWEEEIPIAEGYKIVRYMKESAEMYGVDKHILYKHKVKSADWHSREQKWTLEVEATLEDGSKTTKWYRAPFLVMGTGYYDYDQPLKAKIPGLENFKGRVLHPQFWDENLKYDDRKIAVIGSGATAITLIPALAKTAGKVTMVQRSPSYIVGFPNRVRPKTWWERILPLSIQHRITRLRFIIGGFFYRRFLSADPDKVRAFLAKMTQAQLPKHIAFDPHFVPKYTPWTQRMCLCPDSDFFKALHKGNTDIVTGTIQNVTENKIIMTNGQEIEADIIVTATGLRMKYGGNTNMTVDGETLNWGKKFLWRGVMVSDVPNMAIVQGYTKASWTLGADATAAMVMRMVKHLEKNKLSSATPRVKADDMPRLINAPGVMGLTSTYIMTALHRLPKTSEEAPWKPRGDYLRDMFDARFSNLSKGMQFTQIAN